MAANAPTILYPAGGETGLRPDRLIVRKSAYSGDDSQTEWQIQFASDSGFAAADIVWDTLLRAADGDRVRSDDRWDIWPSLWSDGAGPTPGGTYYGRARVRNGLGETSSWSSTVSFTFEAARLTAALWERSA